MLSSKWYKGESSLWMDWWWRLGARRPVTVFWDFLDWRLGVCCKLRIDGSGEHAHATVVRIQLGPVALEKTVYWGKPRSHKSTIEWATGFGSIGGQTLADRHAAREMYEGADDE